VHNWRFKRYGDPRADKPIRGWHPLAAECTVPGCPETPKALDLCPAHWDRWYRTGDPGPAEIFKPREGCDVSGCPDPHVGLGFCKSHLRKFHLYGDPTHAEHPGRWAGDDVGYDGVHKRLRALHGEAAAHPCRRCDKPAKHWAYDHADPDERQDPRRGPYSIDPAHYLPLCVSCHKTFDLKWRATS
jgi:hypothetical protein